MIDTYKELCSLVGDTLTHYTDDLHKHDRFVLEKYDGPFVFGWRHCGTDLVRMLDDIEWFKKDNRHHSLTDTEELIKEQFVFIDYGWPHDRNKRFAYFDGKKLKEVSHDECKTIYMKYADELIKKERLKQLQPTW